MAQRFGKRSKHKSQSLVKRLATLSLSGIVLAIVAFVFVSSGWVLPGPNGELTSRQATVATDVLNVRSGPGVDSPIIGSYTQGTSVQVLGEAQDGFVPVTFGNGRGWMSVDYLSFGGSTLALDTISDQVPAVSAAGAPESDGPPAVEKQTVSVEAPPAEEPETEPAPEMASVPAERWIDIDRTTATVTLMEGDTAISSFVGKIGRDPAADGFYSTAIGTFHVYSMNKGLASTPFADDTYLTDWVGFDPDRKNGIHSPVRDSNGVEKEWQNPATLGCVRLDAEAAISVFNFAEMGMRVVVHD